MAAVARLAHGLVLARETGLSNVLVVIELVATASVMLRIMLVVVLWKSKSASYSD